jgi:hypothetical protein
MIIVTVNDSVPIGYQINKYHLYILNFVEKLCDKFDWISYFFE